MAVPLTDEVCAFLAAIIIRDLKKESLFPNIEWNTIPNYFELDPASLTCSVGLDYKHILATLFNSIPDSDTFFSCLAALHKTRLKFNQILCRQPFPSFDQIGPRGLLQFGTMGVKSLSSLLHWRKWLYDIDNRAAQDTGYLFEPILAHAIGGTPVSARKSPVKRHTDPRKGRQVDCIRDKHAFEFKLRLTIAASGQGRWKEELEFPIDCKNSGYIPVLIVLDPTSNPKLTELKNAFEKVEGQSYVGNDAWKYLEKESGATMSVFLENYIRRPMAELMAHADEPLEDIRLRYEPHAISISIGNESQLIKRQPYSPDTSCTELPDDVDEDSVGL